MSETPEANFSFTTKIGGDLFTVRGHSHDEFRDNLAAVLDPTSTVPELLKKLNRANVN